MTELLAGVVGGLGLFIVGMWFLTENLKTLASRRLRQSAQRWTTNPFAALLWGMLAGGITQSMSALTFIVVGILRSRLIAVKGALAMILGGGIGVSGLVMIVTFDIKLVALYAVGIAGAVAVTDRLSKYRAIAASFLGGAMIILGLVLLREAAAPLADQPWFRDMVAGTGNSLVLAFAVAALLTFIVQSSGAVSVFGISLAAVEVISIDQAIMIIYGSFTGSSAIIYALSAKLRGRSRQIAMYLVIYNTLICVVVVPLLYAEIYLDVPSVKALISATGFDLAQQLALVYLILCVAPVPIMLAGLGIAARVLERLWPVSEIDELSRTAPSSTTMPRWTARPRWCWVTDGSEDAFDWIGRPDMPPVLGREVVEGQQGVAVLCRPGTEAHVQDAAALFRARAAEKGCGPASGCVSNANVRNQRTPDGRAGASSHAGSRRPQCTDQPPKTSFVAGARHGRHHARRWSRPATGRPSGSFRRASARASTAYSWPWTTRWRTATGSPGPGTLRPG